MRSVLTLTLLSSMALAQQSATPPPAAATAPVPDPVAPANVSSLLPGLPPLPAGKATRIGGTISRLDQVQDKLTIRAFGGNQINILFDGRTRIDRGGAIVPPRELRNGQRVALDTVLDGNQIFARNIHILPTSPVGETHGQVLQYEPGRGELMVRDPLAPGTVTLRLASYTQVLRDGKAVGRQELVRGALVAVQFVSDGHGNAFANQISILAMPGGDFSFPGRVTYLSLGSGLLVVTDSRTQTSYEIHFNPDVLPIPSNLQEGSDVTVIANFEGSRYVARSVTVNPPTP